MLLTRGVAIMSINMFLIATYLRERAKQFKQVVLLERGVWEKKSVHTTTSTDPEWLSASCQSKGGTIWVQVQLTLFCLPVKISVAYQGQGGFSF